jgi:hypothetical protein
LARPFVGASPRGGWSAARGGAGRRGRRPGHGHGGPRRPVAGRLPASGRLRPPRPGLGAPRATSAPGRPRRIPCIVACSRDGVNTAELGRVSQRAQRANGSAGNSRSRISSRKSSRARNGPSAGSSCAHGYVAGARTRRLLRTARYRRRCFVACCAGEGINAG